MWPRIRLRRRRPGEPRLTDTARHNGALPTVLVTGAAGYIGSHIVLAMLGRGWRVVAVDDLSAGSRAAVPPEVEFLQMDCAAPEVSALMSERGVQAVVHMAARISTDESVADPLGYYASNLSVARSVFEHAFRAGVRAVVFSSTAAVYGEAPGRPVREDDACQPLNPYGRSKLAAEWILRDLSAATDVRHVIFRYFNVAGADPAGRAGPRPEAAHLIKRACEAAVGLRPEMTIFGDDYDTPDGTCIRDYVHVSDLAEAHIAAVDHLLGGGESLTLNCGYGRGFSVREVLDAAQALALRPFGVAVGKRRPGDPQAIVADASALGRRLAWRPALADLTSMIRSGMDWEIARSANFSEDYPSR